MTGTERLVRPIRPVAPWRIDVEYRDGVPRLLPATALRRAIAAALVAGGAPAPAAIAVILSDDVELAALHETHLGQSGATDVLSFPMLPPEAFPDHPGKTTAASVDVPPTPAFALPPGRRVHLGDIIVSVERAIAQAAEGRGGQTGEVRWAASEELRLLVTHGTLHVCGWDHAEPLEEAAMRSQERKLLESAE